MRRLQANLYCPEIRSCNFASIEDEQRNSQLMARRFVPSSCRPGDTFGVREHGTYPLDLREILVFIWFQS